MRNALLLVLVIPLVAGCTGAALQDGAGGAPLASAAMRGDVPPQDPPADVPGRAPPAAPMPVPARPAEAEDVGDATAAAPPAPADGPAPPPADAEEPEVVLDIRGKAVPQPDLVVAWGTMVTWVNHDYEPHIIVSNDGQFTSGEMNHMGQHAYRFFEKGTWSYQCPYHPELRGTITVE